MNNLLKIMTAALLLLSPMVQAQNTNTYNLAKGYILTIQGGSNLHAWSEKAGTINGTALVEWNNNGSFNLNGLKLIVKATSITSSEGFVMNDKTYKALRSTKYPVITFELKNQVTSIPADGKSHVINATGDLVIAGVSRLVNLNASVVADDHGQVMFNGSYPIKMSDYNIEPPTALFGTLKVTNDININFRTAFLNN